MGTFNRIYRVAFLVKRRKLTLDDVLRKIVKEEKKKCRNNICDLKEGKNMICSVENFRRTSRLTSRDIKLVEVFFFFFFFFVHRSIFVKHDVVAH